MNDFDQAHADALKAKEAARQLPHVQGYGSNRTSETVQMWTDAQLSSYIRDHARAQAASAE
ncbi:hypothetical protein [Mesorhizobium sp. B2-3-4]|uniref:hypothetical protein n=1 Tax=Mesorhizobium sp. B2-3-4 TaxID=2589959 RepID=UPI0011295502|nr:hypothetical protein [Mesorhizobium sp. B2-3-4]TPM34272.1 hypothetical protein FJ967_22825 [Mesorhizobium sp. B2-3-4]